MHVYQPPTIIITHGSASHLTLNQCNHRELHFAHAVLFHISICFMLILLPHWHCNGKDLHPSVDSHFTVFIVTGFSTAMHTAQNLTLIFPSSMEAIERERANENERKLSNFSCENHWPLLFTKRGIFLCTN